MKYKFPALLVVVALTWICASGFTLNKKSLVKTAMGKVSYAIGQSIGKGLKMQDLGVESESLATGLTDALAGTSLLTDDEMQETLVKFQQEQMVKQQAKAKEASEKNIKAGDTFLEGNKKKEGVVTTASGLQYKILKTGTGKMPKLSDTVIANYVGTLIDGKEFDSSYKRKEPATFPVKGVIPGWTEALQLMHVGDKWQLFIPAKLAYGERGAGGMIGPNETLIFEVELVGIK